MVEDGVGYWALVMSGGKLAMEKYRSVWLPDVGWGRPSNLTLLYSTYIW